MPRPKGSPATESQRAAGRANLAKGRARREEIKNARQSDPDYLSRADRWAMLLDGRLTVKDLSDAEVRRRTVADSNGRFDGSDRAVPSHLLAQFDKEYLKRMQDKVRSAAVVAQKEMLAMLKDPEVPPAVRANIGKYMLDRFLGKTPETIHVKSDDWAGVVGEAVDVERDITVEDFVKE